jgi:hypothetical protein
VILFNGLRKYNDCDYFEIGMEIAIDNGMVFYPEDISDRMCVEIDFIFYYFELNYL